MNPVTFTQKFGIIGLGLEEGPFTFQSPTFPSFELIPPKNKEVGYEV